MQNTSEHYLLFSSACVSDGYGRRCLRGLTGVGGFLPISSLSEDLREGIKQDPATITVGPNNFFACIPGPGFPSPEGHIMWCSIDKVTPAPTRDVLLADIRTQLLERHASWKSPYDSEEGHVFSSIISLACGSGNGTPGPAVENGILILPQYGTRRLPRWCSSSGKCILLGDAAHPIPPESGQGVSCTFEDGLALALILKHYLVQCPSFTNSGDLDNAQVLQQTRTAYEEVRIARLAMVLEMAKHQVGNLIAKTWQRWVRDWIVWMFCKLDMVMFPYALVFLPQFYQVSSQFQLTMECLGMMSQQRSKRTLVNLRRYDFYRYAY
jgi:hypothetical protein